MSLRHYATINEAEKHMKNDGFNQKFRLVNDGLLCTSTEKIYTTDSVRIVEFHRFKPALEDDPMMIIFAIECLDGHQGLLVSEYGTRTSLRLMTFMDKVKIKERAEPVPSAA